MAEEESSQSLEEKDQSPLRISKGQISYNGLQVMSGRIYEECNRDLRWPHCITTYKAMCKDATIAPALNLMEMHIKKVKWKLRIPEGYEDQLGQKKKFLEQCFDDMEHSFGDFIRQAATFNRFGFAPVEKVYRKRSRSQGSKYNDGLYGLKKLVLIAQDSVDSWEFDESGRSLTGLNQFVNKPQGKNKVSTITNETVFIPRKKFILFRSDPVKDSPIGTSPLNAVYMAWRYKTEFNFQTHVGVIQR